jgi:acetyl-CoA C-acetyltransferase
VAPDPRAPCIIGAARRTWHEQPAPEPLDMWEEVARAADADAGGSPALSSVQSLQVVYCQAWEYDDPCRRLADRLGAEPGRSAYSGLGGSVPVRLVSEAAAAMAAGEIDLALVIGGEALATRRHLPDPPWSFPPGEARPFPISVDRSEARHGIFQAYLTFALLDSARRIHLGRSLADHRRHLGDLLAPLTEVAASQPEHAWFPTARTAEEITSPSPANRMVATPYTKLMTAIMDVDMAAAVLVATEARADELGVPRERRVYLRGTGGATEPETMASRPEPWRSPAMERAMEAALAGVAGAAGDDVAHLDLYSCFASSLDWGWDALGVGSGRALTVTGGLPYHGGPGSNYGNHALSAMTDLLREDPGALGLVSGIGMHMTSHSAALLSTDPGASGIRPTEAAADETPPSVPMAKEADGPAEVLAYSTVFSREGPEWTALICQLADGSRSYARLEEPVGEDEDMAGATVTLRTGERRVVTAHR